MEKTVIFLGTIETSGKRNECASQKFDGNKNESKTNFYAKFVARINSNFLQ